jgi:hypothetical protein
VIISAMAEILAQAKIHVKKRRKVGFSDASTPFPLLPVIITS